MPYDLRDPDPRRAPPGRDRDDWHCVQLGLAIIELQDDSPAGRRLAADVERVNREVEDAFARRQTRPRYP